MLPLHSSWTAERTELDLQLLLLLSWLWFGCSGESGGLPPPASTRLVSRMVDLDQIHLTLTDIFSVHAESWLQLVQLFFFYFTSERPLTPESGTEKFICMSSRTWFSSKLGDVVTIGGELGSYCGSIQAAVIQPK